VFAETIQTAVMRRENARILSLRASSDITLPPPRAGSGYMLYVHVPFCERLCPYCSFNRYPFREELARRYFKSLRSEMFMVADMGYDFSSVYFGGGTPTILIDELCRTIDLARELFSIKEVSTETNPNHLIPEIIDPLVDRVQRFSVGVQSFDDSLLKQMERYDKYGSGEEILERLKWATGRFHSMNVDMIFNFPSQTAEMLMRDVRMLEESGTNQTTFYPLMTSKVVRRSLAQTVGKVSYRREYDFYRLLDRELASTFQPATAWTYSRTGGGMIDEYIVDYEEYVGIGSGAFSYLDGAIWVNTFSLDEYDRRIAEGHTSVTAYRKFDAHDRMRYRFMMGIFGLELDKIAFEKDFGVPIEEGLKAETMFMRASGAYDRDDEVIKLTPKGRYLSVAMMREFFAGVNNFRDEARAALPPKERELLFGGTECKR